MRQVDRRRVPIPAVLISDEARIARRDIENFLQLGDDERRQRRAPYVSNLVRNDEVIAALTHLFQQKCAFCEVRISNLSRVEPEHFRPRQFARGAEVASEVHYAWLSYDWENLYPVCEDCSQHKKDLFPVAGRRARSFTTVSEARSSETALLIDPCFDDPRSHMRLRPDGLYTPLSQAGEVSIKVLGLNRGSLVDGRRTVMRECASALDGNEHDDDRRLISRLIDPDVPFLGAVNQYLSQVTERLTGFRPRWPASGVRPETFARLLQPFSASAIAGAANDCLRSFVGAEPEPFERVEIRETLRSAYFDRRAADASPRRVHIRGFKGIEELELHIPAFKDGREGAGCLMLLGENAAGKSSVLEAVALALAGTKAASRLETPENLLRRKGGERYHLVNTDELNVRVEFYGDVAPAEFIVDPLAKVFSGEDRPISVVMGYGPRRYTVPGATNWSDAPVSRLKSLFKPVAPIADARPWLTRLADRDDTQFYAVARALREILALRTEDSLVLDDDLGICVRVNGRLTPIDRMSEGYKSLFAMAVDIMRGLLRYAPDLETARGVVLIDELETHLHPRWKLRVMAALRRAMPRVTFIATTHDPLCLRGMEDGEVVVLHKDADQRITQIRDLPSVKGMRAEQLLTSDYFGLNSTADPDVEDKLSAYVAALTTRSVTDLSEIKSMERGLSQLLVLGETAGDQVVQEALGRYLAERRDLPPQARSAAREEIVEHVLAALRRPLEQ